MHSQIIVFSGGHSHLKHQTSNALGCPPPQATVCEGVRPTERCCDDRDTFENKVCCKICVHVLYLRKKINKNKFYSLNIFFVCIDKK